MLYSFLHRYHEIKADPWYTWIGVNGGNVTDFQTDHRILLDHLGVCMYPRAVLYQEIVIVTYSCLEGQSLWFRDRILTSESCSIA